ncbi:MAG: serine/threonine protein kinase, partial [Proteobacteria bacterium]|nr:serine/threonine protein kinase [Pseudomonadota bacterium]
MMSYQPGDWIADKYQLIESIGGGGMGEIFKAEHALMHRTVAIKILHKEITGSAEMIERFKREASSAAAIDHANICTVLDFDITEDNDFYLVMEFLEGETLKKRIHDRGVIPPKDAVFIMQQLLGVLQCAHDHGIVHRDIKPDNIILINRDGTDNFVKLLDFGIAHRDNSNAITDKEDGASLTQAGYIYGTPEYIAPEQANGQAIDHRVDLYACGIILYEMLTGVVPFKSDSIINVLHQQIYADPPHLDTEHILNGAQFDAIIQKLLAKKPEDRFQSAREVTDALQDLALNTGNTLKISKSSEIKSPYDSYPRIGQFATRIIKKLPEKNTKLYFIVGGAIIVAAIVLVIALVSTISNDAPPQETLAPIPEKVDITQAQDPETAKP